ncbi:MAG TPA: hypothetical protein VGO07_04250 [Candidatus Saccharimonadales bacterium]|jgi:hypothetical protein|nr:hypothetical protein [Candidatus Saccharimonadales bacterium]
MIQSLKDMLGEWNGRYNERAKLQHAYIVACVAGIVIAGLVGLLNYDASRAILRICFAGLGIVVVNAIAWALLFSFVTNKLPKATAKNGAAKK